MYIELHDSIFDSLKTQRLARALDVQVELAVGLLARLWHWGLRDADTEGNLPEADADEVAFICRWFGDSTLFVQSLMKAGFLVESGKRYRLHNWESYGGKLAAKKERNAARMKDARAMHVQRTCVARDVHVPDTCIERDAHVQTTCAARAGLEERREEESITSVCPDAGTHDATPTTPTPKPGKYSADFEAFWQAYPTRRRKEKPDAFKAWAQLTAKHTVAQVMASLEAMKRSSDWTKDDGEYVPMPGRWLRRLDPDDVLGEPQAASDDVPEPIRNRPWVFLFKATPGSNAAIRILSMLASWGVDIDEAQGLAAELGGPIQVADHYWALRQEVADAAPAF